MNCKLVLITIVVLLLLDSVYLFSTSNYFNNLVEKIQGTQIEMKMVGVVFVYLVIAFGLNYFIIERNSSVIDAFILGLFVYGVYEFTNYSIFKKWDAKTVVMDTLWGGILFAGTTYVINKI